MQGRSDLPAVPLTDQKSRKQSNVLQIVVREPCSQVFETGRRIGICLCGFSSAIRGSQLFETRHSTTNPDRLTEISSIRTPAKTRERERGANDWL